VHAAEQERPDVALARAQWKAMQPALDTGRVVFIDETGASTKMARQYGRSKRGRRVVGRIPWGHWKTVTLVAGLREDGLVAPFVIDCPMNGAIFLEYLRRCLVPALRPGDSVVMDNLGAHKNEQVRALIDAAGASVLYLPPYSPDLNPIEQAIAKIKAHLRKAKARTLDALYDRIGEIVQRFGPAECRSYFTNSGYASA
jgi:transposase